jgi:hypothetical protein
MSLLQAVQGSQFSVDFGGQTLRLVEVFDFRYPGMLPLTCILHSASTPEDLQFRACLVRQGDTFMLPVRVLCCLVLS